MPLAAAGFDAASRSRAGDKVLIIGAGAVGILIALARYNGAADVIFCRTSDHRIKSLRDMGFQAVHSIRDDVCAVSGTYRRSRCGLCFRDIRFAARLEYGARCGKIQRQVVPVGLPYVNRAVTLVIWDKELDIISVNLHQLVILPKQFIW